MQSNTVAMIPAVIAPRYSASNDRVSNACEIIWIADYTAIIAIKAPFTRPKLSCVPALGSGSSGQIPVPFTCVPYFPRLSGTETMADAVAVLPQLSVTSYVIVYMRPLPTPERSARSLNA